MNPAQELFDQLVIECESMGYKVYDHLPMENKPVLYPFLVMGMTQLIPVSFKGALGGQVHQTIDVWGDSESRSLVTQIINKLVLLGSRTVKTKLFRFAARPGLQDLQILTDTSVADTVLYHGIITLVFELS